MLYAKYRRCDGPRPAKLPRRVGRAKGAVECNRSAASQAAQASPGHRQPVKNTRREGREVIGAVCSVWGADPIRPFRGDGRAVRKLARAHALPVGNIGALEISSPLGWLWVCGLRCVGWRARWRDLLAGRTTQASKQALRSNLACFVVCTSSPQGARRRKASRARRTRDLLWRSSRPGRPAASWLLWLRFPPPHDAAAVRPKLQPSMCAERPHTVAKQRGLWAGLRRENTDVSRAAWVAFFRPSSMAGDGRGNPKGLCASVADGCLSSSSRCGEVVRRS